MEKVAEQGNYKKLSSPRARRAFWVKLKVLLKFLQGFFLAKYKKIAKITFNI